MSTTLNELKAKQVRELENFERIERIKLALADVPGFEPDNCLVCLHGKFITVKLWRHFRPTKKLVDADAVVQHFKDSIVEGEHWKDGCVSTWPAEINSCIKAEKAVMDGSHAVEIEVQGGKGYEPDVSVNFWTRIDGSLCEICCPVCDCWQLVPRVKGTYGRDGHFNGKIEWNSSETQTADSFRKFWSEPPAYNGSYYFADVPNFESWASHHGERKAVTT